MAIARGAGTEIIRSAHFETVSNSYKTLIYGVRHHIYTVLSIIVQCQAVATAGNYLYCYMTAYDSLAGTAQRDMAIFLQDMNASQSFVWNDKFSFNGYEPVDFTGPIDSEAKQDAIADQLVSGDSNRQTLKIITEGADDMAGHITYIDQNNA